MTRAIVLGDTPVIGAVRGWAVGGGLEWVINCDFAIAAEGTRFFFPEISLGVFVTGGVTELLPRLVGLQRARELIMLGERFDAAQAQDWGLVWKVVPDAALMPEPSRSPAASPPCRKVRCAISAASSPAAPATGSTPRWPRKPMRRSAASSIPRPRNGSPASGRVQPGNIASPARRVARAGIGNSGSGGPISWGLQWSSVG